MDPELDHLVLEQDPMGQVLDQTGHVLSVVHHPHHPHRNRHPNHRLLDLSAWP